MDKDLQYYAISGQELDPGETYTIRVRSFAGWNEKFSDGSNELLIKTCKCCVTYVLKRCFITRFTNQTAQ